MEAAAMLSSQVGADVGPDHVLVERIVANILMSIDKASLKSFPFCHCYFTEVLPEDVYRQIRHFLPGDEQYKNLNHRDATRADGSSTRKVMPFNDNYFSQLELGKSRFWRSIHAAFADERIKQALFTKLEPGLKKRHGNKIATMPAYPKGGLFRDLSGYQIRPHKDAGRKIVTTQFYLPVDDSQKNYGTTLYRRSFTGRMRYELKKLGVSFARPEFETVKTFPFMPNTGYAFVVGNNSWHGREEIPIGADRYSLMNIYYENPNEKFYD